MSTPLCRRTVQAAWVRACVAVTHTTVRVDATATRAHHVGAAALQQQTQYDEPLRPDSAAYWIARFLNGGSAVAGRVARRTPLDIKPSQHSVPCFSPDTRTLLIVECERVKCVDVATGRFTHETPQTYVPFKGTLTAARTNATHVIDDDGVVVPRTPPPFAYDSEEEDYDRRAQLYDRTDTPDCWELENVWHASVAADGCIVAATWFSSYAAVYAFTPLPELRTQLQLCDTYMRGSIYGTCATAHTVFVCGGGPPDPFILVFDRTTAAVQHELRRVWKPRWCVKIDALGRERQPRPEPQLFSPQAPCVMHDNTRVAFLDTDAIGILDEGRVRWINVAPLQFAVDANCDSLACSAHDEFVVYVQALHRIAILDRTGGVARAFSPLPDTALHALTIREHGTAAILGLVADDDGEAAIVTWE